MYRIMNELESKAVEGKPSMFVEIERAMEWRVCYHRETKVMYAVSATPDNYGNFTLLVNPDGSPMIYKGE